MARRMTKKETVVVIWLVIIGAVVAAIFKFFEAFGYVIPLVIVVVVVFLYWLYKENQNKQRLSYIREKYKNEDLVQKIFKRCIWQGQTAEQLIDTLGQPVEVDNKVLKTKKKETWKYGHQGANRFNLRITLENCVVVGWDKKA